MGKKSTQLYYAVSAAMRSLKEESEKYDKLVDYFQDEMRNFMEAPSKIKGDQRNKIYARVKSVSTKFVPKCDTISTLLRQADSDLGRFERFLLKKAKERKDDWFPLKKKSLDEHTENAARIRPELETLRERLKPCTHRKSDLPNDVAEALEFCEQALSR